MAAKDNSVSLPDLYTTTQRFFGIESGSHFSTTQSLRPAGREPKREDVAGLYQTVCAYMRLRQMVWDEQASKQRIPRRTATELHTLEMQCASGLRKLNAQFFQRFDDKQLTKILRGAPICNFAKETWLFSRDPKEESDPPAPNYYFIIHGSVHLYERSPKVTAEKLELSPGTAFAEGGWPEAHSAIRYRGAGAQANSTVLLIILTKADSGGCCSDDRLIADRKYANILLKMPIFQDIRIPRLEKWLEMSQIFRVPAGEELLTWPQIDNSFLVMTDGNMLWCADVTLLEMQNPDNQISRRKIKVFCEAAIGLSGAGFFEKLNPYLVVRLSPQKRFQTRNMMNGGKDPYFNHTGILVFDGEPGLEFTVYNFNDYTTHDVLGNGFIPAEQFTSPTGFEGEVQLTKPVSTSIWQTKTKANEPAGVLLVQVTWGAVLGFRSVTKHVEPRKRTFEQVNLLDLGPTGTNGTIFGHEQILLGDSFITNLRRSTIPLGFELTLSNFSMKAKQEGPRMTKSTCIRIPRHSFEVFINRQNKQKDMLTEAVNSSLEKQVRVREVCFLLIHKWNEEDRRREQQKALTTRDPSTVGMDVNSIRAKLRGAILTVRIVSAVGLSAVDKLDPYIMIKIVGSTQVVKSPVYEDAGANPIFDFEARFRFNGETVVDIAVWDKDRFSKDEILGTTSLSIEQFHDGFVGSLEMKRPATLAKNAGSAGTINIEVEWSDIPGM
jgi:hypothetical protein